MLGLYEKNLEKEYDIYHQGKIHVSVNKASAVEQTECDLKNMTLDHQLLALKMLFKEKQVALLQNNKEFSFATEQLTRFGIVQINCEGKPHFIHRKFAEYYVADSLVNRLTECKNTSQQV